MGDRVDLEGLPVLLTGASGFVGAAVVTGLVAIGADVHAVHPGAVLHLASHVEGGPEASLVLPARHTNLLGTVHLLAATNAWAPEAAVVVTGTMMEPATGEPSAVAGSPYAMAKPAASGDARMYHLLYALRTVVLRLHMVYGPGQRDARKLLMHTGLSVLRGERPHLSSGAWETDWIDVDDVAAAVIAAAAAPGAGGATVDIGTGVLTSVRDVVSGLASCSTGRATRVRRSPRSVAATTGDYEYTDSRAASRFRFRGFAPANRSSARQSLTRAPGHSSCGSRARTPRCAFNTEAGVSDERGRDASCARSVGLAPPDRYRRGARGRRHSTGTHGRSAGGERLGGSAQPASRTRSRRAGWSSPPRFGSRRTVGSSWPRSAV